MYVCMCVGTVVLSTWYTVHVYVPCMYRVLHHTPSTTNANRAEAGPMTVNATGQSRHFALSSIVCPFAPTFPSGRRGSCSGVTLSGLAHRLILVRSSQGFVFLTSIEITVRLCADLFSKSWSRESFCIVAPTIG